MSFNQRVLYLSHGGGPLPLLGDSSHIEMIECLQQIAKKVKKPSAIIVFSAHWEQAQVSITAAAQPQLDYDYYGFPDEAYSIQYPCNGCPPLADEIHLTLSRAGIRSKLDQIHGFDHGVFVPLKIMFPEANIPCIQISLINSLNPEDHINIGKALQQIDFEGVLIVGSGSSFHNLNAFFAKPVERENAKNRAFESWLINLFDDKKMTEANRTQQLIDWERAPSARYCHPREEHLLPLHVCYGTKLAPCAEYFELSIMNKKLSMFLWL